MSYCPLSNRINTLIAHTLHTKAAQKDFEGSSKSLFQHKDRSKSKMRFHSKERNPTSEASNETNNSRRRKRFLYRIFCTYRVNTKSTDH